MDTLDHFLGDQYITIQEHRALLNDHLRSSWQPLQLISLTFILTIIAVRIWDKLFDRDKDIKTTLKESFFKFIRSLPVVGAKYRRIRFQPLIFSEIEEIKVQCRVQPSMIEVRKEIERLKIQQELDASKAEIADLMFPLKEGQKYRTMLPEEGLKADDILDILKTQYKSLENTHWEDGRCSGVVYSKGDDDGRLMTEVFGMFLGSNMLIPEVFPGPRKMEAEIVSMVCNMFKGGEHACGVVTSCGTESILLACKAYREYAYKKGIKKPEILLPESAHAAFTKAGEYFKMKIVKVPLDKKTFKVNINKMKKMVNSNTAMLVGSVPSFPHGACDPIEDIAKIGKKYDIPVHVDQCMGGFLTPFAGKEFTRIPRCDLSVDGVTSISADTHKYGKAPKGSSTLVYSHTKYREGQFFRYTDWSGGLYASSTMAGTRSGAIMATCWTALMSNGLSGYTKSAKKVLKCREYVEESIRKIPQLKVFGEPGVNILSFGSDVFDIYRLGEILNQKGWHMYIIQIPAGINLAVTSLFAEGNTRDEFMKDVRNGTAEIMKCPNAKSEGMAAVYGMAAKVPDKSILSEFLTGYLDAYYHTKG